MPIYKKTALPDGVTEKVIDKDRTHDVLPVKAVKLQPDGKTVFLEIGGLKAPINELTIKFKIHAADGAVIDTQVFQTIHELP